MKIKSHIFVFLIIACLLFSISMVSANEISDDTVAISNDYQSDMQLNNDNDSKNILDNYNNELNSKAQSDVLNQQDSNSLKGNSSNFNQFAADLKKSGNVFNMTRDYTYDKNDSQGISINFEINNLTINGNGHVLDGTGADFTFGFSPNYTQPSNQTRLVINDLTFRNFTSSPLSIELSNVILNNVNITDCSTNTTALINAGGNLNLTLNNCNFYSNSGLEYINIQESRLIIKNSYFSGKNVENNAVVLNRGQLLVENSIFDNFHAKHGSVINYKGDSIIIRNSKFMNSKANATGGAIIVKFFPIEKEIGNKTVKYYSSDSIIENCQFLNLSSTSNGGAIHLDMDSGTERIYPKFIVSASNFTDCSSRFGGAISMLGGYFNISNSRFANCSAGFEGGAIYSSWTNLNITRSSFISNNARINAGAIYFDKGKLQINSSSFTNNYLIKQSNNSANAIYAHDVKAIISHSVFDNGGIGVYFNFAENPITDNVVQNDDVFSLYNQDYIVSVENPGIKLNLTNNSAIIGSLPSRFDARDYEWTTPGKVQGDNDDCWAFATVAALDTALGKATGTSYNLSQNYVQKLQLKYFQAGDLRNSLTGFPFSGLGYSLSWLGVLPVDGVYDDRGMISDTDMDVERIHVQDAMIIPTGQNNTVDMLKRAIMKYGAVSVQLYAKEKDENIPTEGDDIAIMDHGAHFVTLIGWDDEYNANPDDNSSKPGFVWFTKDSLFGFSTSENLNFPDIEYYSIAPQRGAVAYIFENNIDYHVNYQTDLTGLAGFDGNYTSYSNEFTSKYDELIGAVGTYFNDSGIKYSFDVLVNNQTVLTQTGVSEFAGFRTIKLNKYIPIKTGDNFKVVFNSNSVPYQAWSRMHYMKGTSLASKNGTDWIDFALLNKTVCLKVYTVADDTKIVNNSDITVDYDGGSYFTVKVVTADNISVGAGESVVFKINGKTVNASTDSDGIAKIKISELPGKYTITTTYRGVTYKNTVTVKQVLTVSKVSVKNTDKKLTLKATLKINGKPVSGKTVKFTFMGKTYTTKTNSKGVASYNIKQSVVKKLTKKSYTVKATYLKDTVKGSVYVKQVLKAYKATVKKSSKTFKLKASLKINGKAAKKKVIKFTFKGKTYKAKTNNKGIAQVTIKKTVINKLKKGKTYSVKVSYGKAYVKTTVKVK